jgi:hypothetical protein
MRQGARQAPAIETCPSVEPSGGTSFLHGPMQEPQHADDDQIDGDDVVQQPRHDENQDPGDEGDDWLECGVERHFNPPCV